MIRSKDPPPPDRSDLDRFSRILRTPKSFPILRKNGRRGRRRDRPEVPTAFVRSTLRFRHQAASQAQRSTEKGAIFPLLCAS